MSPRSRAPRSEPSPRPTPRAPAGATRQRILRAATGEFARHGYDGARIDAMARAAGVNKALLYYYFPNKAELYRGLVLEQMALAARTLEEGAAANDDPAAALAGVVDSLLHLLEARPEISDFLLREVLNAWGHLRDEDFPILFRATQPIASIVERGVASGQFRPVPPLFVHLTIIASLNFFFVSRAARARGARATGQPAIDPDPAEYARFVAQLVTRGLAASPGSAAGRPRPGETA